MRLDPSGSFDYDDAMAQASVLDSFLEHVNKRASETAALVKREGAYRDVTWGEIGEAVRAVSMGLISLGIQPEDRVCIVLQTRLEWVIADMGILGAGGVTVPIYASNLPDECQYVAENSGAVLVFAEDDEQVQKFRAERSRLPNIKKIVQVDGAVSGDDGWVITLDALKGLAEIDEPKLKERRASLNKDSNLTIIYTSGTTGRPRGVVLTHDNMLYQAECLKQLDQVRDGDVQLIFLPLAHSFAKILEIAWIAVPHVLAFAEDLTTVKENLGEVRPTLMAAVPRIYEKFYTAVIQKGTASGGLKAKLFGAALELSEKRGKAEREGGSLDLADSVKFALLKEVIFKKVGQGLGEALGGRMRMLVSGGAPLSPKIAHFFEDAGLDIFEGYGLTETSPVITSNHPGANRIGTVGKPLPGTQIRLAEDGEIFAKGRQVMREYWDNPEATKEVIDTDGWFRTGDIGEIDRAGFLRITDRKKDIIVTAGGKNVAPQNLENLLKTHPLVSQVVVHGDKRKFLTALITLDADGLKAFSKERKLGNGSHAEMTQKPAVRQLLQEAVDALNAQLPSYETIKKFKILEHDFSEETGELTPSLKVKRRVVNERHRQLFDAFYEERF